MNATDCLQKQYFGCLLCGKERMCKGGKQIDNCIFDYTEYTGILNTTNKFYPISYNTGYGYCENDFDL